MPRYDYRCQQCGHLFEIKQSYSSEPVADCPECHSQANRLIHSVPVVFKGSGFYVNDYGKGSSSTAKSTESKNATNPKENTKSTKSEKASEPVTDNTTKSSKSKSKNKETASTQN